MNKLFKDGRFDGFNIWRHPRLAPYVETVLLPPVKDNRHSSALAIMRRFDFDSDLRYVICSMCLTSVVGLRALGVDA